MQKMTLGRLRKDTGGKRQKNGEVTPSKSTASTGAALGLYHEIGEERHRVWSGSGTVTRTLITRGCSDVLVPDWNSSHRERPETSSPKGGNKVIAKPSRFVWGVTGNILVRKRVCQQGGCLLRPLAKGGRAERK